MAALGRILQVLGWLWFAAGFASRFVDIPNFSVFPGLILIFVARMIRTQAARQEMPELPEEQPATPPEPAPPPERQLNTERQRTVEPQTTVPEPKLPPPARPKPEPEPLERDDLLERIALAGETTVRSATTDKEHLTELTRKPPKTSEEMIAEARKRWDSKKR